MIRPIDFSRLLRCWPIIALLLLCTGAARGAQDAAPQPPIAQAPPNHAVLKHTRGGVYYVAKDLKEQHDKLIQQLKSLRDQVDGADIPADEALKQLQTLKQELEQLQKQILEKRVLVSPAKTHTQKETITIELGPERLLAIAADHLTVVGWDGPGVKCVLEKTVLTTDDKPVDEHFKEMRLIHRHARNSGLVGRTDAEFEADEKEFLATPDGQKLTAEQRDMRRRWHQQFSKSYQGYEDFQGREFDSLTIEGLRHEHGNRQLQVRTESKGGNGTWGSDWQRHATLTVFVPTCKVVALRGCGVELNVKGLKSKLRIGHGDSDEQAFGGRFEIRDHQGDVRVEQVPIQRLENVTGNVSLLLTKEFGNYGTSHRNDWRTAYVPPADGCVCKQITGDVSARIGRFDLRLEEVTGQVDVRNAFGNTTLVVAQPLASKPHLLFSESGRVEAMFAKSALGDLPIMAMSSHGKVSTNTTRETLDDVNFFSTDHRLQDHPGWRGFHTKSGDDSFRGFMTCMERTAQALAGEARTSGLDLLSSGGTVVIKVE